MVQASGEIYSFSLGHLSTVFFGLGIRSAYWAYNSSPQQIYPRVRLPWATSTIHKSLRQSSNLRVCCTRSTSTVPTLLMGGAMSYWKFRIFLCRAKLNLVRQPAITRTVRVRVFPTFLCSGTTAVLVREHVRVHTCPLESIALIHVAVPNIFWLHIGHRTPPALPLIAQVSTQLM